MTREGRKFTATFILGVVAGAAVVNILPNWVSSFSSWIGCLFRGVTNITRKEQKTAEVAEVTTNTEATTPHDCPGVESTDAGKTDACAGCPNQTICASGEARVIDPAIAEIKLRLEAVRHKVLVLSGKGGVGKSTVASQLAWAFQQYQFDVGLLDIDICGPSIPRMTGSLNHDVHPSADGWSPVYVEPNFAVMSIGFMLPDQDDPIVWRGPKKNGLIRQFLSDVLWGSLDCLFIDTPPGTSDEHLSIVTYLKDAGVDGAVIVTTPQEVALSDVRKEINFCKKTGIPVLGVVENMAGSIFLPTSGGAEAMSSHMAVPFLGRLSLLAELFEACESGDSVLRTAATSRSADEMRTIFHKLSCLLGLSLQPNGVPLGTTV